MIICNYTPPGGKPTVLYNFNNISNSAYGTKKFINQWKVKVKVMRGFVHTFSRVFMKRQDGEKGNIERAVCGAWC